jgi:two-component system, OmpR family, sensor histidine kinase KdpD
MGAAVGVGKTYRMFEEAHLLRREGHDVALGFVETHGRTATAALIGISKRCLSTRFPIGVWR